MGQTVENRTGETHSRHDSVVQGFLDRFARAVTSGDTATLASMWETPAFVLGDLDARCVGSRTDVEQFFAGAREQYNARGITDTRADVEWIEWLTDKIVVVQVRWPYLDAKGMERGDERSTYTLMRGQDGELKLRIAVMQGASQPS